MAVAGLSARPYLDHNMDPRLASDLRGRGFDATYAQEVRNARATDEEHLRWAAAAGRVLLTYDRGDFHRLATEWAEAGDHHAGIVISAAPPLLPYGTLLRRLLVLLDELSAEELADRLVWLDASWDRSERSD